MRTPWGMSDSQDQIFEDIFHYGTPSHGGIAVPEQYHQHLTKESVEKFAENPSEFKRGVLWFEEDCAYKLPLLEIKASLNKLSTDELKKSIGGALYWGGLDNLKLDHPLYRMIEKNKGEGEIIEAIKRAKIRIEEEELSNSPGGIRYRMQGNKVMDVLSETKVIHKGGASTLEELKEIFHKMNMQAEWDFLYQLFEAGKLVFTGTVNGDLYIEERGGDKYLHVDQYPKGKIVLINKA